MKRNLFLIILVFFLMPSVLKGEEKRIQKKTFIYSVKGADTLRMDRYDIPGDTIGKPCVIFMFGGGFYTGARDAEGYSGFFEFLVGEGYTVASIDYRLGFKNIAHTGNNGRFGFCDFMCLFQSTIMMAVEDLFDATNFVLDNAAQWGIDPGLIVTCGSSAGAITVLQGEYERCNRTLTAQVLPQDFRYAGVISFAGAVFSDHGHLKWNDSPAPVLLFHGDADKNVPYSKLKLFRLAFFGSEYIARKYENNGFPFYFHVEKNADHKVAGSPMTENRGKILDFIQKYVLEKQQLQTRTTVTPIDKPDVKKNFGIRTYIETNLGK